MEGEMFMAKWLLCWVAAFTDAAGFTDAADGMTAEKSGN